MDALNILVVTKHKRRDKPKFEQQILDEPGKESPAIEKRSVLLATVYFSTT
jgi:hypothetical protein